MALLFCDGFDHYATADLNKKWDVVVGGNIDNSSQRNGVGCFYTAIGDNYIKKVLPSTKQTLVVGFALFPTSLGEQNFLQFLDLNTIQIIIGFTLEGKITAFRGSTLLGTSTDIILNTSGYVYLEIKIYIHGTAGTIEIRKNGQTILLLSDINTQNTTNAYITSVCLTHGSYSVMYYIDDLYIDDANFLGDIKIETLYPSGAGATTSWDASTGSNYACVDETPLNSDTDYVSTLTTNEVDTYAFSNLVTTAGTIYGVQTNIIARKDDAGSRSIAPVVRPVSTDRVGDTKGITDGYMDYIQMYTTNPEDSQVWEIADVNGAEFGIKLIS